MNENKPRRRWFSFGIRDLLWAMVVVGLALGWRTEYREKQRIADILQSAMFHWELVSKAIDAANYEVTFGTAGVRLLPKPPLDSKTVHRH